MKRLAFALLIALSFCLVPTTAWAGTCTGGLCGTIVHTQQGVNAAITIRCNFGDPNTNRTLLPGMSSASKCQDTDQVHVDGGREIWCNDYTSGTVWKWADATGWYKINDLFYQYCFVRND